MTTDSAFMSAPAPRISLPPPHSCVRVVSSFAELLATPFANGINALCWPRALEGDFAEVVARLAVTEGIVPLDDARLASLPLTPAGRAAAAVMLDDVRLLREQGLAPSLDCIAAYPREDDPGIVPVDVYSFHADSAPIAADTWLCTYHGATSEALRPEDALRCTDLPGTRAALLKDFGGADDADFAAYLHENCYDLHYVAAPHAQPYAFGRFNLWRIAVDYPDSPVPPCVHRAPENFPGQPARLLLIS
jgi:hypothetical protein